MIGGEIISSLLKQKLYDIEKQICKNNFETAFILDNNGAVLLCKKGNKKSVMFSKRHLSLTQGNILTHNHPFSQEHEIYNINKSFLSSSDLVLAYQYKLSEIRMVIGNEWQSFKWINAIKSDIQNFINHFEVLEISINAELSTHQKNLKQGIYKTTDEYFNAFRNNMDSSFLKLSEFFNDNKDIGYIFERGNFNGTI